MSSGTIRRDQVRFPRLLTFGLISPASDWSCSRPKPPLAARRSYDQILSEELVVKDALVATKVKKMTSGQMSLMTVDWNFFAVHVRRNGSFATIGCKRGRVFWWSRISLLRALSFKADGTTRKGLVVSNWSHDVLDDLSPKAISASGNEEEVNVFILALVLSSAQNWGSNRSDITTLRALA